MMVERIMIGILLVSMLSVRFEAVVPLGTFSLLALFIAIKRPYLDKINNIRAVANMGICVIVEGLYLWYRNASPETQHKSSFAFYAPLIVCILLLLCVVYNSIALVANLIKKCRSKTNERLL